MNSIVTLDKGNLTTTSKIVSDVFGKVHKDVIKALERLDCSEEFSRRNFTLSEYVTERGKTYKCYNITRDGFSFLCMGFTGKKAAQWKEKYIEAFNEMEKGLGNFDARATKLSLEGKGIEEMGKEWSRFGHYVNKQKKAHDESVNKLMDEVQLKLGFS
jgi:Rha family phage regulatory protein